MLSQMRSLIPIVILSDTNAALVHAPGLIKTYTEFSSFLILMREIKDHKHYQHHTTGVVN